MGGRPGNLVPRHWLSSAGVYDHVSKGMKTALVGLLAAYFVLIEGKSMSRNANNEANNAKNTCSLRMDCGDSSQTDNGISVVMGPKGERGPQGPTGDKGCDGGKGDKGEKGEPGVKGQDGLPGLPDRPTNPVAFSVAQATNRDSSDLSRNSETIPYDTVLTNIGDAYNNVTGRFKAPVKGTFFFTVTMAAQKRKEINFRDQAESVQKKNLLNSAEIVSKCTIFEINFQTFLMAFTSFYNQLETCLVTICGHFAANALLSKLPVAYGQLAKTDDDDVNGDGDANKR